MSSVTISSKFQIVIPREIRQTLKLRPGQKLSLVRVGKIMHLVPEIPIQELRGIARGIPTSGIREKKDRAL